MSNNNYSLGVVTYHARFESYFKPLIKNLARIFPDREILCVINGHPDQTLQIEYLDQVTNFMKGFANVRYLTHVNFQPLSKSWNQLIALSHTEKIVILGDDVFIGDLFREELEKCIDKHEMLFLLNRTFCHFVTSKETVRKVGWFEERFPGIGWEDNDYLFRMNIAEISCKSEKVLGVLNLSTDNDNNPGWENPDNRKMKYTSANEDFFRTKWLIEKYDGQENKYTHDSESPYGKFALKSGMETPNFYDLSILDNGPQTDIRLRKYKRNNIRYYIQKILFIPLDSTLTILRKIKRFLKKVSQIKPPL